MNKIKSMLNEDGFQKGRRKKEQKNAKKWKNAQGEKNTTTKKEKQGKNR
jgi:hypothetical protein